MSSSLVPSALLALIAFANPEVVVVDGAVSDVLERRTARGSEVWATTHHGGARRLVRVRAPEGADAREVVKVSRRAVFVDACATGADDMDERIVFVDDRGLVDDTGTRLVEGRPLAAVADPESLFLAEACPDEPRGELRLATERGVVVRSADGALTTLPFDHRARAYSGRVHRGFRPARAYAAAVSLFAPRLVDVDVDGDGALDLVVAHEERVVVFPRRQGRIESTPLADVDLRRALSLSGKDDVDLRILIADADGDRRADIVVGVTAGALPERSSTWLLSSASNPFAKRARLFEGDGLEAPIAVVTREGKPRVLVADVDTSMMSLGSVLLSGSVDVETSLRETTGARTAGPTLAAAVDVRRARMVGALPVADVDLDGDGLTDLVDVGLPGRAFIYLGHQSGYAERPSFDVRVPAFHHIVTLEGERAVVLIGAPSTVGARTKTSVALVRAEPPGASSIDGRTRR